MARYILPLTAFLLMLTSPLARAEDGFRLRSLNPFHEEEEAVQPAPQAQVIGVPNYRPAVTPPEPTLLDRLGDGTRSTFGRVGDVVRSPFQSRSSPRVASHDGWFQFPWNRPQQQQSGPGNVSEWIDLERPQF